MSLQNRVSPRGKLVAVSDRGARMRNRGILHNESKEIVAQWRHKSWVTCRIGVQGIRRAVLTPHSYSELFFLDEATAFVVVETPTALVPVSYAATVL